MIYGKVRMDLVVIFSRGFRSGLCRSICRVQDELAVCLVQRDKVAGLDLALEGFLCDKVLDLVCNRAA